MNISQRVVCWPPHLVSVLPPLLSLPLGALRGGLWVPPACPTLNAARTQNVACRVIICTFNCCKFAGILWFNFVIFELRPCFKFIRVVTYYRQSESVYDLDDIFFWGIGTFPWKFWSSQSFRHCSVYVLCLVVTPCSLCFLFYCTMLRIVWL